MNDSVPEAVAARLKEVIATLKSQAEGVPELGMLVYLLGMAEEEARSVASGEHRMLVAGRTWAGPHDG